MVFAPPSPLGVVRSSLRLGSYEFGDARCSCQSSIRRKEGQAELAGELDVQRVNEAEIFSSAPCAEHQLRSQVSLDRSFCEQLEAAGDIAFRKLAVSLKTT